MAKHIAIVGAGAKAAALAARAWVLNELLVAGEAPVLHIFEGDHVGSSWTGDGNFSNGYVELCTPAEKDVGFPYREALPRSDYKASVAARIFERFSWGSFLVDEKLYDTWIDRGRRHPSHSLWGKYLIWVIKRAGYDPVMETVTAVHPLPGDRWQVVSGSAGNMLEVDAVVLTGTGKAKRIPAVGVPVERVLDAETFWNSRDDIIGAQDAVAVAGDGGAAGTIIAWLAEAFAESTTAVLSISPMGTLFPRGDGYAERRWFSDPREWAKLKIADRRKLLSRTEAGVISLRNKQVIDGTSNVRYIRGKVSKAVWHKHELTLDIDYGRSTGSVAADYLISAIGFDPWTLLDIVKVAGVAALTNGDPAVAKLRDRKRSRIEAAMLDDLSFPSSAELGRHLHMPNVAGVKQGPGMGNLNSLGLMAAAILDPYIVK